MSNKQSSVGWLFNQLIDEEYINAHNMELISIIEQAKAMHKEEIENAFDIGANSYHDLDLPSYAEQYYDETFNNETV